VDAEALRGRVDVWLRSGIISPDQADRILALEEAAPATESAAGADSERRGRIAEVVGYVGAAFALGALALLIRDDWSDLAVWARISLIAVLTLTALGSGAIVRSSRPSAASRRLVGVLWLAGVIGSAWTTGILAWDVLGVPERWIPSTVGAVALVIAAVLLALGGHIAVQLATLVALGVTTVGTLVAVAPLEPGALTFGAMLVGGGATWALAGAGGWLGPRVSAEASGAVVMLVGAQVLTATAWPLSAQALASGLAGVLVALSVVGGRVHLLYIGAIGLFVSVPRLVFELFADTLGAPATLLTAGVLLIILAAGLGRARKAQEALDG